MTPAARIQAVIELLEDITTTPRPADTIVSNYFRDRRFIGSKDRAAVNTGIYRIMRRYHRLDWWIKHHDCEVTPRTMVIADLMFEHEYNPQTLDAMFSGDSYSPEIFTHAEFDLAKALENKEIDSADVPLRERTECPEWAFESLRKDLGANYAREMYATLPQAPMDLRVNLIKSTRDAALQQLQKDGIDAHAGKLSPWCIRVFGRPQIMQNPLYMNGVVEIQDEGSQMVAVVADVKPDEQVIDFCAGAGGKTLALGAAMANKGRIIAMDVMADRLEKAKLRFRRAGLHNIETRPLVGERDRWVKRHQNRFDCVLVDAPCTGTGTWRRDPDKRWRILGPTLAELIPLQQKILDSAFRLVKGGGRLVYATCSFLKEENEEQIELFLREHPDFYISPVSEKLQIEGAGKFMRLSPALHETDGFFAAVLMRKETPVIEQTEETENNVDDPE